MNNVHIDIQKIIATTLRIAPAKVQPCDHCGPGVCKYYPCEDVDPKTGPDAIAVPAGAKE
ncbi:MAG: hypothetical protein PHS14_16760 [Elusimicrobia bacterium]|nr:hypothetical protein [Elusimicrobiota bacterium]